MRGKRAEAIVESAPFYQEMESLCHVWTPMDWGWVDGHPSPVQHDCFWRI